jgi:aryl-alcohol dehydrogenase-like predicted oxidoreductase
VETRRIGSLDVSVVGLGCNNFGARIDAARTAEVVDAALEAGVNFFDTADVYGKGQSEEYLGRALGGRRAEVIIATKFGKPMDEARRGARPEYIREAAEASLRRLSTDYIDLYQIHEPDPAVPIEETLGALDELVQAGKVREIGCSNFSVEQLREGENAAARGGLARFVSVQNEYSLLHREPETEVLPACEQLGVGFVPYFPLASGLLTGKYRRGEAAPTGTRLAGRDQIATEEQWDLVEALERYAQEREITLIDVAVGALLAQPAVSSVIAGATKPEQVRTNAAAARWRPDEQDMTQLAVLLGGQAPTA